MANFLHNIDIYFAQIAFATLILFFLYRVIQGMEQGEDER